MDKRTILFALAVNKAGNFEKKHFGEAEKYQFFKWTNNDFVFVKEEINPYKNFDENSEHGSQKKGKVITEFLKSSGIQLLVSRQFGKNIQLVNRYFVPVIINAETPGEILPVLLKHIKWIEEELNNKPTEFKLFTINKGIMKTVITNEII